MTTIIDEIFKVIKQCSLLFLKEDIPYVDSKGHALKNQAFLSLKKELPYDDSKYNDSKYEALIISTLEYLNIIQANYPEYFEPLLLELKIELVKYAQNNNIVSRIDKDINIFINKRFEMYTNEWNNSNRLSILFKTIGSLYIHPLKDEKEMANIMSASKEEASQLGLVQVYFVLMRNMLLKSLKVSADFDFTYLIESVKDNQKQPPETD